MNIESAFSHACAIVADTLKAKAADVRQCAHKRQLRTHVLRSVRNVVSKGYVPKSTNKSYRKWDPTLLDAVAFVIVYETLGSIKPLDSTGALTLVTPADLVRHKSKCKTTKAMAAAVRERVSKNVYHAKYRDAKKNKDKMTGLVTLTCNFKDDSDNPRAITISGAILDHDQAAGKVHLFKYEGRKGFFDGNGTITANDGTTARIHTCPSLGHCRFWWPASEVKIDKPPAARAAPRRVGAAQQRVGSKRAVQAPAWQREYAEVGQRAPQQRQKRARVD